ncbi:hypothetical protein BJ322DRAFT_781259 [Thelephora terrestris]|uniref:Uncharacterized protein n=1 Tax=Thelephora terrestris TaxID=56493 RepID=A0A9P6L7S4_9AGAM|nr:hypothetical protein BJ322DRAFT_781259 [Thelephora terrestris]
MTIFPPLVLITSALLQTPLSRCKYALLSKYNLKKLHITKGLPHAISREYYRGDVRIQYSCVITPVARGREIEHLGTRTLIEFPFGVSCGGSEIAYVERRVPRGPAS